MDFAAVVAFCSATSLDRNSRHSVKAFEDSLKGPGGSTRDYTAKVLTLLARGKDPEGATLFQTATGIESRDRHQAAAMLRWTMETEHGCEDVIVGSFEEIVNK